MNSITISVHSFVDVITNSSSEVFVTATEKTVEVVKELARLHLAASGSTESVDDVFDIGLVWIDWDDVEHEGTSECRPSKIRVSIKENHAGNYDDLVRTLNRLNSCFVGEEFMC